MAGMKKPALTLLKPVTRLRQGLLFTSLVTCTLALPAGESTEVRVTATVVGNCKILSTEDISFSDLDPGNATDRQSTGIVSFACTKGINYNLRADNGEHFDSAISKRRMKGVADGYLPYKLDQQELSGLGQGFSRPVEFRMAASVLGGDYRDLPADNYADTIRIILEP